MNSDMLDVRELGVEEVREFLVERGEKGFRAAQVWQWVWQRGVTDFDAMSNLPLALRGLLKEHFVFHSLTERSRQRAEDGTTKVAWLLFDGKVVESVLIPSKDKFTVCVSSQAGCPLGCAFCATGQGGFGRNLSAGEIFDQVVAARAEAEERGATLSNIVFMGMGEPLLNYESVMRAIAMITGSDGLAMSPSRITLSTAGVAAGIRRLADDGVRFNLAVSLHSAVDAVRTSLMPLNKSDSLASLSDAVRYFVDKTGTRPTFEYLLLAGVNDSLDDAKALATFCRRFPIKINLIEYNEVEGAEFRRSPDRRRDEFVAFLEKCNMVVNLRRSKGAGIDAACGQLAGRER